MGSITIKAENKMYQTLEIQENFFYSDDNINVIDSSTRLPIWTNFLPSFLIPHLFPPSDPLALQLLRPTNMAIPGCYLCVGLLQGFSGPLLNVYPLFLNASEGQQTVLVNLLNFPAS